MGRCALLLGASCLLLLGGAASMLLAAPASSRGGTTSGTTAPAITTIAASTAVVVTGHGWGHGLGLSQWGAYGYAKHGWTYDRILAHYYTGTTLGPAPVASVRVLLASATRATIESAAPWTVLDATGTKTPLEAGALVLKPKLAIVGHPELEPPFTFAATQPLTVNRVAYRGQMTVSGDGKLVQVIDRVGLEAYLRGVVPAEMPSSWSPEALKAQAVAARSYALANVTKGRAYDLYGDTRSQVYGGVKLETATTDAALAATKGEVVLYAGKVADTLFFSTSGGRTASALESTGQNVPYLVPVADPYDTLSPYHDWGPLIMDAAKVARVLKLASPLLDVQSVYGASGRVKSVTMTSDDESQVTINGNQARTAFALRSTWFTPALLELQAKAKTITYGGALSLQGRARNVALLSLEAKPFGLDWSPAGEVVVEGDGTFATAVHPQVGTQYRLASGTVRVGLVKVAVAPRVDATIRQGTATGKIAPAIAGAAVQLQWSQDGTTGWQTAATGVTDAAGAFSVSAAPQAGTYRVRVAPGHGLAPGLSKPVCC
ncbi:MAG: SpoIID/LytB domain-containing protein [Gaiellaceae bacterium]